MKDLILLLFGTSISNIKNISFGAVQAENHLKYFQEYKRKVEQIEIKQAEERKK
jgi:hypothetical protein